MDEKKKSFLSDVGRFIGKKLLEASPYIATDLAYKKIFYHRIQSEPISSFDNSLFPYLISQRVTFKSDDNVLTGYYYSQKNVDKSKIVVFVHGYGNGHHRYLDIINYLASKGLYVFSYDATAFDESNGDGIYGFPQAIIDLECAVNFVKLDKKYKDKDIIIMGHSMGGYATGAYLNINPNISKVVLTNLLILLDNTV